MDERARRKRERVPYYENGSTQTEKHKRKLSKKSNTFIPENQSRVKAASKKINYDALQVLSVQSSFTVFSHLFF
jgi:hypothetical protein